MTVQGETRAGGALQVACRQLFIASDRPAFACEPRHAIEQPRFALLDTVYVCRRQANRMKTPGDMIIIICDRALDYFGAVLILDRIDVLVRIDGLHPADHGKAINRAFELIDLPMETGQQTVPSPKPNVLFLVGRNNLATAQSG